MPTQMNCMRQPQSLSWRFHPSDKILFFYRRICGPISHIESNRPIILGNFKLAQQIKSMLLIFVINRFKPFAAEAEFSAEGKMSCPIERTVDKGFEASSIYYS